MRIRHVIILDVLLLAFVAQPATAQTTLPPPTGEPPAVVPVVTIPPTGEPPVMGTPAVTLPPMEPAFHLPAMEIAEGMVVPPPPPRPCVPNMLASPFNASRTVIQTETRFVTQTSTVLGPDQEVLTVQKQIPQVQQKRYLIPATGRAFRISNNESPVPQDRVFKSYLHANGINPENNQRLGGNASVGQLHSGTFGLEKTFFDGIGSVGFRLPVQGIHVDDNRRATDDASWSMGDLFLISKMLLYESGNGAVLLSGGVAFTIPIGPAEWGNTRRGSNDPIHSLAVQPYLGYIWHPTNRLYFQGFTSVDVPFRSNDVTLMFNDLGVGYFLVRDPSARLSALVPTLEVRFTTPMNQRMLLLSTSGSAPDVVELLGGVTFEFFRNVAFTVGGGAPVTGLKPYDWNVQAHLNCRY